MAEFKPETVIENKTLGTYLNTLLPELHLDNVKHEDGNLYIHGRIRFHIPYDPKLSHQEHVPRILDEFKSVRDMADNAITMITNRMG